MRHGAMFLTSLWFVLPCHGQEVTHPFPSAKPLMVLPQDGPVAVEPPLKHGDTCNCEDCGRIRRLRSSRNPYHRFRYWWDTQAQPFLVDTHWGYHQFFHERSLGFDNNMWMHAQITQAAIDQLVLYQYDFEEYSARLRPRGHKQLKTLAAQAEWLGQPLIIEETADRQLDEQRRAEVVNKLVEMGVARETARDRVRIGAPTAFGLARGGSLHMPSEPELIWQNQLHNSQQRGQTPLGRAEGSTRR